MNYEEYHLTPSEWILYGGEGAGVCALISYGFYRSAVMFLLLLPLGLLYPLFHRKHLKEARLFRLNQQFKEGILILAANLSAGYSIENALANSSQELDMLYGAEEMINREFSGMVRQIRMNQTVEQVFFEFADRSGLEDVRNFAQVFKAAKRSGGDLVAIINHTAGVIRDKAQVREEIMNMTASKKLEQKIMNLIPFFLIFYIDKASPGFFGMMYGTIVGRVLMTICLGVYGIAFWLSKRILNIPI
ncbi:MAG: type II secretion system F family protein [Lachnospiraceae bacterium]|nr:type II secretion system F family protein [Lachnospiraceae bacterium]